MYTTAFLLFVGYGVTLAFTNSVVCAYLLVKVGKVYKALVR